MNKDSNQRNDDKFNHMLVFTEKELLNFSHPNVLIENDMVTIKSVASWTSICKLIILYGIAMYFAFKLGLRELSVSGCLLFVISSLFLFVRLLRKNVTTVFDKRRKTVYLRNFFNISTTLPFDKIYEIITVNCWFKYCIKIALEADHYDYGIRISSNYNRNDKEFLYIICKAVPAINDMLKKPPKANLETKSATTPKVRPRTTSVKTEAAPRAGTVASTTSLEKTASRTGPDKNTAARRKVEPKEGPEKETTARRRTVEAKEEPEKETTARRKVESKAGPEKETTARKKVGPKAGPEKETAGRMDQPKRKG
jgi:hypothetical protein